MKMYTVRCVHFNHYKVNKYFKLFAGLKKIQTPIDLLLHDKNDILFFAWLH